MHNIFSSISCKDKYALKFMSCLWAPLADIPPSVFRPDCIHEFIRANS